MFKFSDPYFSEIFLSVLLLRVSRLLPKIVLKRQTSGRIRSTLLTLSLSLSLSLYKRYCHLSVEARVTSNAREDVSPSGEKQRANSMSRCIKAESRGRGENFSNAASANAKASAREDSPIFPGGNRQVSPGWRSPPKYCLLGELCLSRLSVCPIHFTSSVPHSPFALARCFSSD